MHVGADVRIGTAMRWCAQLRVWGCGHFRAVDEKVQERFNAGKKLTLSEAPPVMLSPNSTALLSGKTYMTRLAPLASSTTLPATSASMVTLRSMQSAEPPWSGHMSSLNS